MSRLALASTIALCVLLLVLVLGRDHAAAFERARAPRTAQVVRWRRSELRFEVAPIAEGSALRYEALLRAAQRAGAAWSRPKVGCTSVRVLSERASNDDNRAERDGVNRIVFHSKLFCRSGQFRFGQCYDRGAAAMTTLYFAEEPIAAGREASIDEVDIELNGADFRWTSEAGSHARVVDLETVLVHEIGHALGFAHVCSESASCEQQSVMRPSADRGVFVEHPLRELYPDDRRGVCATYPRR